MKKISKLLSWLETFKTKLNAYDLALSTITYDDETIAPVDGATYRNKCYATIAGEAFTFKTCSSNYKNLKKLQKYEEQLPEHIRRSVNLYVKSIDKIRCIPKNIYLEFVKLQKESNQTWRKAKKDNNYALYKPYLLKIIEMTKQIYKCRTSDKSLYDQMLDDYEEGMTTEKYDAFFGKLKEAIIPLIQKIVKAKQINNKFLLQKFSIEDQKKFNADLLEYLGFTKNNGYIGSSAHPFSMELSIGDVRITTRYSENDVSENIFSVIHEVGHAFFQQQINPLYEGWPLTSAIGSGLHESQSRLLENNIARTVEFWKPLYAKLQASFPKQLKKVSIDNFISAINISKPSFIRTDADELTYPLHIIIRYEIEKDMFNGNIDLENLDKAWNDKYKEYLGLNVTSDSIGILQDVHWSDGSFGYFPAYALGSAMSAQWYNAMNNAFDIKKELVAKKFSTIKQWLKENIHSYGALYTSSELLKKSANEDFNPQYYIDYLVKKYSSLYKIK